MRQRFPPWGESSSTAARRLRRSRHFLLAPLALAVAFAGCSSPEPMPTFDNTMEGYWSLGRSELEPGLSEEESSIRIARWVATNSTNQRERLDPLAIPFYGRCGYRATVFEELARRAGLEVARLVLDDFAGSGHTAVEVRWGGDWHFFDVTYAGYFRRDGEILSFAEVQADPRAALDGMHVFEGTHDRWRDGRPFDNARRMTLSYTAENVAATAFRHER